jgi:hypothetical protein
MNASCVSANELEKENVFSIVSQQHEIELFEGDRPDILTLIDCL